MLSYTSYIMNDDDIDLEDLECRLYSQVYHSNAVNEEINLPYELNLAPVNEKTHSSRYFSRGYSSNQSSFIPLEERNENVYPLVYNNISFTPYPNVITEDNFPNQFHNNITVNQYTVPLFINTRLSEVLDPNNTKLLVARSVKDRNRANKKNKLSRSQKKAENRRKRKEERKKNSKILREIRRKGDDVIDISDESDSECVIVKDMCNKTSRVVEESKSADIVEVDNTEVESDDDIIYVPPPPVLVIDVDAERDNESVQEASDLTETTTEASSGQTNSSVLINASESCASNDFLDNSGIENNSGNFNFSLHGSDFNNTGDFLRPPNPVEYCETESSCSTNDLNRENNSVKTIVFNEVDFPREDIFSDKNLESFGTYITPKRSSNKPLNAASKSTISENESCSSSSESDYEPPDIVNRHIKGDVESKKLPTLSPMQSEKAVTSSTKLHTKKKLYCTPPNGKKNSNKRRSDALSNTESDSDANENSKAVKKSSKKKKKVAGKKRNLQEPDKNAEVENSDTNNEEYVAPAGDTNIEEYTDAVNECVDNTDANTNSSKKKKKNGKKHEGRKKRKHILSEDIPSDDAELNQSSSDVTNLENTKLRNNGSVNDSSDNFGKENTTSEEAPDKTPVSCEPTVDKVKRKKKKSLSENVNRSYNHETNQSPRPADRDNVNEFATIKDILASSSKQDVTITEEIHVETLDSEAPSMVSANITDAGQARQEVYYVEGDVPVQNDSDEDIILISPKNHTEIVVSSDSEYDFDDLGNVGQDLELANCSARYDASAQEEIVNVDGDCDDFNSLYLVNNNLCEDYSKFDVEQIQNSQSDNPDSWKISPLDQLMFLNCNRNRGPRCARCRQFGHIAVRCVEKPHPPKCTLCGFPDHQEPRCPNKRCNQCGNEGDYSTTYCWKCVKFRNSICRLCNMKGHIAKVCPDLWRRYHLTTEKGPIVVPDGPQMKPRDQQWCSGCARQGHLEHECNYCIREYPPTNPGVMSYEDVLYEDDSSNRRNTPTPPPPPVISAPPQTHFSMPSLPHVSSTSHAAPVPPPFFIPPLMSQIIPPPIFPLPTLLNETQPPPHGQDANIPVAPTKVLNPFSVLKRRGKSKGKYTVLLQMLTNYVKDGKDVSYLGSYETQKGAVMHPHMVRNGINEVLRNDQKRVRHMILSMPAHVVRQFVGKDVADLENIVSQCHPRFLKQKLFKYDKIAQSKRVLSCDVVKEKCFWSRILNMFIFGVHQWKDGKLHIDYIRKYLAESKQAKLDTNKRKSLLNAYNYIFDATRHGNVNYYKVMQQLIEKADEEKKKINEER